MVVFKFYFKFNKRGFIEIILKVGCFFFVIICIWRGKYEEEGVFVIFRVILGMRDKLLSYLGGIIMGSCCCIEIDLYICIFFL